MSKMFCIGLLLVAVCVYGGVRWWSYIDQQLLLLSRRVLVTKNMETYNYSAVDFIDDISIGLPIG